MKSRELMGSVVYNDKSMNPKLLVGKSIDGKSKFDVESKDSGRQSVGSEANGAILTNQAKGLRDVYTTHTLNASEKRNESYIKINSGRDDVAVFKKIAEVANSRSDSSSSLREAPHSQSLGAAEIPRKTD